MEKRLKAYMEYLKNLDIPEGGNPELAQKMLEQIRIFQHERLVHLIVTMSVAVFMMAAFLSWFVSPNLGSAVFTLILMALLAAYLRHYYILENTIQSMYPFYDRAQGIDLNPEVKKK